MKRRMCGTLVSHHYTHIICLIDVYADVQQFAVWEKDAHDESDFIGHCYFDLYPRGMLETVLYGIVIALPHYSCSTFQRPNSLMPLYFASSQVMSFPMGSVTIL